MRNVGHVIDGVSRPSSSTLPIIDPTTGDPSGEVAIATRADVDAAVAAAQDAGKAWAGTGLQSRAATMLDLRQAVASAKSEFVDLVIAELGKTLADATAEVDRAIEVLGQAASVGTWSATPFSASVSKGVDAFEVRYPIGVVAAVSPFNFPILIPVVQVANAIATGNTVILKPSERVPSAATRLGELFVEAGLPRGVLNVVHGGKEVVDLFIEHPGIAGITFVGSTPVARAVRERGVARGKRVQAFGGGKNHLVVMPDADLDMAADAAVSAGFGAAGQRCMAVSVVVAVGGIGDDLVARIAARATALKVGDPRRPGSDIGPIISQDSHARVSRYLNEAESEGGTLVVDGRQTGQHGGWWLNASVIDYVRPDMAAHRDEIFGPVLSIVRVESYDEAIALIAGHPLGNGAAIFTRDGAAARQFVDDAEAGQVGVNVPIPFPVFFHGFGGWKDSAFTETKLFGPGALAFCTRTKTVSARWPDPASSNIDLGFPMAR